MLLGFVILQAVIFLTTEASQISPHGIYGGQYDTAGSDASCHSVDAPY
jgi:hypothetical protein